MTNNGVETQLCGQVNYLAWFDGLIIDTTSQPMKYSDTVFTIYSEDEALVGMRQLKIVASLQDYP